MSLYLDRRSFSLACCSVLQCDSSKGTGHDWGVGFGGSSLVGSLCLHHYLIGREFYKVDCRVTFLDVCDCMSDANPVGVQC